ncbi:hypothetical protein FUAX_23280 [Fulvitalea axinellae]|uniref:Calcineurin-like phosphoesterase domain-containing protein n=2 Tax=Fulvitalea axinellae TaxID=1182444 RepID=A0AAU9DAE5_9BACT|nr:hypothetical protein FUAX_23280 [Fulvitalea axinellae]
MKLFCKEGFAFRIWSLMLVLVLAFGTFSCGPGRKGRASASDTLELLREPYLQAVFSDSASVLWKTNAKAETCKVLFGLDTATMTEVDGIVEPQEYNTLNYATLKGLERGKRYYYKIITNGKVLASGEDYYFKTEPADSIADFSFYAMGDIGEPADEGGFPAVTANRINILERRPDFGIGLGDIVYPDGESHGYDEHFFKPLAPIMKNIPFYPALGNHDWHVNPDRNFTKEWQLPGNEHYYSFDYGNAHFIALDSREGEFFDRDNQVAWLKNDLAEAKGKYDWVFVYLHHNGRTCTYKDDYPHVIKLYEVFATQGVDFVLNGHAHTYERLKPYGADGKVLADYAGLEILPEIKEGFVSITTGAGGKLKSVKKWSPDPENCDEGDIVAKAAHEGHFTVFEIKGKSLRMKAISSSTGEVLDSLRMEKLTSITMNSN